MSPGAGVRSATNRGRLGKDELNWAGKFEVRAADEKDVGGVMRHIVSRIWGQMCNKKWMRERARGLDGIAEGFGVRC